MHNLVPKVSPLPPLSLSKTTKEAEKRDRGNEVDLQYGSKVSSQSRVEFATHELSLSSLESRKIMSLLD